MNVREKLVELLNTNACTSPFMCDPACKYYGLGDCFPDRFADHLIAHGVTVQEWISVKDRLPEIGRSVIAYNAPAKCAAEAMYKGEGMFLQFRWSARLQKHEVTHWMPLPSTEGLK